MPTATSFPLEVAVDWLPRYSSFRYSLMANLRFPSLPGSLRRLFELPLTWTYAGLTLLLGGLAASLVFAKNALPAPASYLVMLVTMVWLARLCHSAAQRWAWLGVVVLLGLGLLLEVSVPLLP